MREKIQLNTGIMDAIVTMAEGNPGATSVMAELLKDDPDMGMMKILGLDDMNIRGSQVWVGYKDHCGQDLEKFKQAIHNRDPEMVDTINKECYHPEMVQEYGDAYSHKAVTNGASFERS